MVSTGLTADQEFTEGVYLYFLTFWKNPPILLLLFHFELVIFNPGREELKPLGNSYKAFECSSDGELQCCVFEQLNGVLRSSRAAPFLGGGGLTLLGTRVAAVKTAGCGLRGFCGAQRCINCVLFSLPLQPPICDGYWPELAGR